MKKQLLTILCGLLLVTTISAQQYYNMWRGNGESGKPEFICNSAMTYTLTGIQFSTANTARAFITGGGSLLVLDPWRKFDASSIINITNRISSIPNLSNSTLGLSAAKGFQLRILDEGNTLYANFGFGKNDDPSLINYVNKWLRIGSTSGIALWGQEGAHSNDTPDMLLTSEKLRVNIPIDLSEGNLSVLKNKINLRFGTDDANLNGWMGTTSNHGMCLGANYHTNIYLDTNYGVFVGLSVNDANAVKAELKAKYSMFVSKGILSEDFAIAPKASWADFVFSKDYPLRSLNEVENFILQNKHLPEVPSAQEVAEHGYSQHDINKILLQKVEELTLYIIQQNKKIDDLESKLQK